MTAAYRVIVAERKDMAMVTVICDCGARLAYPVETAVIPSACGTCNRMYGQNERNALAALGKFHREAAAAEANLSRSVFQFEIKQGD